jgi:hypothetical protein
MTPEKMLLPLVQYVTKKFIRLKQHIHEDKCTHTSLFFAQWSLHILEQSTHGNQEVSAADYNLVHKIRKQGKKKMQNSL